MDNKTYTIKTDKITEIEALLSIADILNYSFRRFDDKLYWLENWQGLTDSKRGFILRHLSGKLR